MEVLSEKESFHNLLSPAFNGCIRVQNTEIPSGTTIYNPKIHKLLEYVYETEMRKGDLVPSIEHPYAVANLILNEIINLRKTDKITASTQNIGFHINDLLNLIAVALLHDVIEDHAVKLDIRLTLTSKSFDLRSSVDIDFIKIIHAHFNDLLLLCNHYGKTKWPVDFYYDSMIDGNDRVRVAKIADRLHNTLSLIDTPKIVTEKMRQSKQQDFVKYYGRLKEAVTNPLFAAIANNLYNQLEKATNDLMEIPLN